MNQTPHKMKAWQVYIPDEWGDIIHAETAGKAKVAIMREYGVEDYTWLYVRRIKRLDDVPFTYDSLIAHNFHLFDEDGKPLAKENYRFICGCEICKPKNA